jgi:hypothetical protein
VGTFLIDFLSHCDRRTNNECNLDKLDAIPVLPQENETRGIILRKLYAVATSTLEWKWV